MATWQAGKLYSPPMAGGGGLGTRINPPINSGPSYGVVSTHSTPQGPPSPPASGALTYVPKASGTTVDRMGYLLSPVGQFTGSAGSTGAGGVAGTATDFLSTYWMYILVAVVALIVVYLYVL